MRDAPNAKSEFIHCWSPVGNVPFTAKVNLAEPSFPVVLLVMFARGRVLNWVTERETGEETLGAKYDEPKK